MNIQHSSRTDQWWTPPEYIEAVREVFDGEIGLDPASDNRANEAVRALCFLTKVENGLYLPNWGRPESIYLNPPGGKAGNKSLAGMFWTALMQQLETNAFGHAIFMAFSAEQTQSTQKPGQRSLLDFPFCVPAKRIRFVSPGVEKFSPSHSNVIVYVPCQLDETDKFVEVFSRFGKVRA